MENGSKELILLKKEFGSGFKILWPHFCICIESSLTKLQLFNNEQNYWSEIVSKRLKLISFLLAFLSRVLNFTLTPIKISLNFSSKKY